MRRDDGLVSADGFAVVRGGAAPEDVAAVLAVLAALGESDRETQDESGYAAWRRGRLAVLARDLADSADRR